jgi:hypothetical protein
MVLIVIMEHGMRLITFSLFGSNPLYCEGAVENARLAKEIYPDWTARFYVDLDTPEEYTWKLKDYGAEVYLRQRYSAYDALNWRFLPFLDDTVDVWISRDCDSRLSWRERRAVDEWLMTDKTCHLMRDCHNHGYSIMAGMFGINNTLYHQRYGKLNLDVQSQNNRDDDQTVLQNHVWPMIIHDHVCHDHWSHNQPSGQPTTQPGDHVPHDQAYGVGLIPYITGDVKRQLSPIYPAGQDNRPFPEHEPMEYGIFVGQIIEADGKPRMNMDVRWEYELRGIAYE